MADFCDVKRSLCRVCVSLFLTAIVLQSGKVLCEGTQIRAQERSFATRRAKFEGEDGLDGPRAKLTLEGESVGASFGYRTSYSGPYIDSSVATNVSAQNGGHAYLPCTVKRLGSQSVSWIRKWDGYLLTVDRDVFIGDKRLETLHVAASDTWTLHIRGVRPSDAGHYECQVSSEPKTSLLFHLNVITPRVEIRGSPDVYVKSGSAVELHCILSDLLQEPPFIFWYHRGQRLTVDNIDLDNNNNNRKSKNPSRFAYRRSGSLWDTVDDMRHQLTAVPPVDDADDISDSGDTSDDREGTRRSQELRLVRPSVKRVSIARLQTGVLISTLSIWPAGVADEGLYRCVPSSMDSANVTLHVLNGEHEEPAAAIQDSSDSCASSAAVSLLLLTVASLINSS